MYTYLWPNPNIQCIETYMPQLKVVDSVDASALSVIGRMEYDFGFHACMSLVTRRGENPDASFSRQEMT